jgi:acyl-CoA dehydrogenase
LNQPERAISKGDAAGSLDPAYLQDSEPSPSRWKLIDIAPASADPVQSTNDLNPGRARSAKNDLRARVEATAAIALKHADAVDREARFPREAFLSARTERLLGLMVPTHLGGEGASVSDVADVCYVLARGCASTAMIFAMHQIMVAILVRHAATSPWHNRLLRRLSSEQLLLASSTTEGRGGGDLRNSICAVERSGSRITLTKSATVMS